MKDNINEQLANLVRQVDSEFKEDLKAIENPVFRTTDAIIFIYGNRYKDGTLVQEYSIKEKAMMEYPKKIQIRFRHLFNELVDKQNKP